MLLYVGVSVIGMVLAAWFATKVMASKHEYHQQITDLHRRIDDAERIMGEADALLERNLTELISNVQQELIRENASLITRFTRKT